MSAIQVDSEIGDLPGVILHPPGREVENMTPRNAEPALYSDILNLSVARKEYNQLECLLQKLVPTYRVLIAGMASRIRDREALILNSNKYQTIRIDLENGVVVSIKNVTNLVNALADPGMDLKPSFCGGTNDTMVQEREQWHSGANLFAIGHGKLIGYNRNIHAHDNLSRSGDEIIKSKDVTGGQTDLSGYRKYVLTVDGTELSRGGGGVRCMTMPLKREKVEG
ncbi:MAG: arginine deiminase family protein [Bacteroidota bacterium]